MNYEKAGSTDERSKCKSKSKPEKRIAIISNEEAVSSGEAQLKIEITKLKKTVAKLQYCNSKLQNNSMQLVAMNLIWQKRLANCVCGSGNATNSDAETEPSNEFLQTDGEAPYTGTNFALLQRFVTAGDTTRLLTEMATMTFTTDEFQRYTATKLDIRKRLHMHVKRVDNILSIFFRFRY